MKKEKNTKPAYQLALNFIDLEQKWGIKLNLLYLQGVEHKVYSDDDFDEVAYTRNINEAKSFSSYEKAAKYAQFLGPYCRVVNLNNN